jgi:hypothetical protein
MPRRIFAPPVAAATRFARSGPSTSTISSPCWRTSAIADSRRTTFTVFKPRLRAIWMRYPPTAEFAAF